MGFLLVVSGCWAGAAVGFSALSDDKKSATTTALPTSFSLLSPFDGETTLSLDTTLKWEDSDLENFYFIQVDDEVTFADPLTWESPLIPSQVTTYTLPQGLINPATPYFWQVRAINGAGETVSTNGPYTFDALDKPIWAKTFGGASLRDVIPTQDGGYVAVGSTSEFGAGGSDILVYKLNADTTVAWEKSYGGTEHDGGFSIYEHPNGGFIVGGYTYSVVPGSPYGWLFQLAPDGEMVWQQSYPGGGFEKVRQTSDGGYIATGFTVIGSGIYDGWLVKLSSSGAIEWQIAYGDVQYGWFKDVQPTNDGGHIALGWTNNFGTLNDDWWVCKVNSSGTLQWSWTYGGLEGQEDFGLSILEVTTGVYFLLGSYRRSGADFRHGLLELQSDGTVVSERYLDQYSVPATLFPTNDGGFAMAGIFAVDFISPISGSLIKFSSNGTLEWQRGYGGAVSESIFGGHQLPNDRYLLYGQSLSYQPPGGGWILETASDGNIGTLTTTTTLSLNDPNLIKANVTGQVLVLTTNSVSEVPILAPAVKPTLTRQAP